MQYFERSKVLSLNGHPLSHALHLAQSHQIQKHVYLHWERERFISGEEFKPIAKLPNGDVLSSLEIVFCNLMFGT